jgi:SAM-dependent methyltransferase
MSYDDTYARVRDLFGSDPDPLIVRHWELLDAALPVLDIGGGQGRNAFFLAREGYALEVLDPSEVGLRVVSEIATAEGLPITAHLGGFETFEGVERGYGGILVFGLVQLLTRDGIRDLLSRLDQWIAPRGTVFMTGHTTLDAGCAAREADPDRWCPIGLGSFRSIEGEIRTYLQPSELERLFEGWETVHSWEGLGPLHCHGDGPLEQHHAVEGVFRR